ncbi:MAG: bifunctional 5,10-methylenetetrahydrofolate dehydrogenase/5,10-methenyltetrahydrofolate cyclohydrolase [Patescibacteria group bacterium]|nr:bifunctional 5,10-methylenetetrahydrofolate dehydrogenase/5,10-methenyltetrahydrofolate cyclohydrolase [Patescibacteria group bacterium]
MRIDGKKIAEAIITRLRAQPKPDKMLAAVLVGDNPQSLSFLKQKERVAELLGVPFHLYRFETSVPEADLILGIKRLGDDPEVGGIIVQLPLPAHYDRDAVLAAINPRKDIDAISPASKEWVDSLPVGVVKDILAEADADMRHKTIAVVGRGFLVGKPVMAWLDAMGKSYALYHSQNDLRGIKEADVIITGVGKGGLIKPAMLKPEAGVIDFGYDRIDGKMMGDFDPRPLADDPGRIAWYTPTPGGTGPILIAEIYRNFYKLCARL